MAIKGRIFTRRSTRSSSGPDSFAMYLRLSRGVQVQSTSFGGAQGQVLVAITSWNLAG
jgi:hypothetical protein